MSERDIADLQARVKVLELTLIRIEDLDDDIQELKTIVVTAIALGKLKWQILFSVVTFVSGVAAIVAGVIKFVLMRDT